MSPQALPVSVSAPIVVLGDQGSGALGFVPGA